MHEPSLVLGQLQFRWISLTSEIGQIEIIARQTNRQGAHSALSAAPKTTRRKDAEFARAPGAIILIKGFRVYYPMRIALYRAQIRAYLGAIDHGFHEDQ